MSDESERWFDDRGLIQRIYLENFVTYDKVEIRPSRSLNLIIGPNGTGKSTIVCAIIIGLGGKPKLIGRATHASDYIKTNCTSAKIEIELKDTDTKNITITRCFNMQNQTSWLLNGRAASAKEIHNVISSLNIQVDNLCQFLPQDKVQDFSKMDSQQLLENTERSVGDPKIFEYHKKLIEYRGTCRGIEEAILNKSRLLEAETQKYEGMKETVGNIKEKKIIKKKIKTLKQKKAWMSYDASRKQLCESKVERDKAAAEMKKLDDQLKPIQEMIDKLEIHIKRLKKTVDQHNSDLSVKTSKVKRSLEEVQNKEREVREVEANREHRIRIEENRDQEIDAVVQQKNKLDNDLKVLIDDVGTENSLLSEQQKVAHDLEVQRRAADKLTAEINASKVFEEQVNDQIRTINAEMNAAKDVEAKRLELLRSRSSDAYQGVMWLRQNRDKFTSTIHEPMMLNIHVKDANYSKYLENIISIRDLMAFVCEDKSDMNRLMGYLRDQQKLKINVVHSDPLKRVRTTPNVPIDNLRQYGFQHYLINLIEAPETIINYLVSMYNIHNIPLGTKIVEDNVDHIPNNFRVFFSQNNTYAVNVSKYTGTKSTRSSRVMGNGALSIILDTAKLRGLTESLEKLHDKRARIVKDIKDIEVEAKRAYTELDKQRSLKQQLQRNVQTIQSLKTRIHMAERKIHDLQTERTSIEEIQASATAEIQIVLKKQSQIFAQYNSQLSDCFKFVTTNDRTKFELELQQRIFVTKKNESQDLRDKCALAEQTYKWLESELLPLRKETQKLYDLAIESTDHLNPTDKNFRPFHTAFAKLPLTIDEIDADLETLQAKVYCLGANADSDQILRNYEKAEANVQKFSEEIEEMKIKGTTIDQKIEELRVLWLTPLQGLVDRINKNFSTYFGLMGCAGEVALKSGDNPNDFDQYGLKIRVKFRDAEELQELTRQRQSGGERAVTTAVYMIALQELSRVPFRCVDEINQGMDAINERRVFELIVQITGKANSSQYFLLTPKLLPDLAYDENVTVHCVFNGAFMIPCTEFDTAGYCKKIASKR